MAVRQTLGAALRRLRKLWHGRRKREQGLALILVLSLVGVILAILSEVLFESQIAVRTSVGEKDRQRAELAALTGAQFAKLLVSIDLQAANLTDENNKSLPPEAKAIAGQVMQGVKSALGGRGFAAMLDGFPIGAEGLAGIEDLTKVNLNKLLDEGLIEALKTVPGYFVLSTTNESTKLNVNLLEGADRNNMGDALLRLFSTPRESRFLEDKGFPPDRLVANIKDYLDNNTSDDYDRSDEEAQYARLGFKHKPKNGKLESLEELRRIPGFHDDEIFALFSPYLTVWPMDAKEKSLDINSAPVELVSALLSNTGVEPDDAQLDKLEDFRSEGKSFVNEREFSTFFTSDDATTKRLISRLMGLRSHVYKVEVRGVSGGIERHYTMVIEGVKQQGGAGGAPPAPGGATPPANAAAGASGTNAAAGAPARPAGGTSGGNTGSVRVTYQRFQ